MFAGDSLVGFLTVISFLTVLEGSTQDLNFKKNVFSCPN